MPWLILALAIVSEVTGTTMMKMSYGFSKAGPTVATFIFYGFSFWALSRTLKTLDVGLVYAIWSSLGTTLVAIVGWRLFGEHFSALKLGSMGLIILGVIGLNLGGGH